MHRSGFRSRSGALFMLLSFSSATMSTISARAEPLPPIAADPSGGPGSAVAPPSPITPLVAPPARSQAIELREVFWGDRHHRMRHAPFPFQGDRPLEGAAFYRALGRDDLARAYEWRGGAKVALAIAGLGAIVTGAIVLGGATPETQCDAPPRYSGVFQPPVCRTDWKERTVATGIGIVLLGPALFLVAGFAIDAEPVAPAERQRLIDTFNASLAPAATDGGPPRLTPAGIGFTASPTFSATGAGVTVDARF